MAYPDFFFLLFYFIAACIHVLGWSGLICVTMCRHWSLDYTLHDNVSTGSPLIVWKMGPIKFQNHIICKSLKLQYKYYLHSIILAGFHGGQAVAKRYQNYSQTFSNSLHSMITSWLSRGISMPIHSNDTVLNKVKPHYS